MTLILIATATAGVASYLVTWLVPRSIGFASYATFAVFWSATYLVVGTLSGVQQEVTRATERELDATNDHPHRARNFSVVAAAIVFAVVAVSGIYWAPLVFPGQGFSLVWPLATAAASYVIVAAIAGSLYGVGAWGVLSLMIALDAILRLVIVGVALAVRADVVVLAWAVALPFPATIALLAAYIKRSVDGKSRLGGSYPSLSWNVARTMLAAAATGVMVSGFPVVLRLTSPHVDSAMLGLYILTITLVRAPLIIVAMSLQSYLIVTFRDLDNRFWRVFLGVEGAILALGTALSGIGYLCGPIVFGFLFPREPQPSGLLVAILIFSSALVACLCVSAPAVLAKGSHAFYSTSWVLAAVITLVLLLAVPDFTGKTVLALVLGPVGGLLVNAGYLVSTTWPRSRPTEYGPSGPSSTTSRRGT